PNITVLGVARGLQGMGAAAAMVVAIAVVGDLYADSAAATVMSRLMLVLVAALGMSGLFAYIAGASFVLQGHYGLDQQAFALVFGAGAVALIGATQFNVVLLRRFAPQSIVVWALVAASLAGVVFVGLSYEHIGGLPGFVLPIWAILAAMGLVIPNAPAVALSRHPDAVGTAAA